MNPTTLAALFRLVDEMDSSALPQNDRVGIFLDVVVRHTPQGMTVYR